MKLAFSRALVGFCTDLTEPNAPTLPVAVVFVGDFDGGRVAAVASRSLEGLALDPISRAMLKDVPAVLKRHVEQVLDTLPQDVGGEEILYSLHNALRNSLHVTDVLEPRVEEIEDESKLSHFVLDIVAKDIVESLNKSRERAEGRGTSVAEKGTLDGLPEASGKTWIPSLRGGQGGWVSDSALRLAQTVLDQAHSHLRKHSSEERGEFQGLVLVDGKWVRL